MRRPHPFNIIAVVTVITTSLILVSQADPSCNFEHGYCGWQNAANSSFGWTLVKSSLALPDSTTGEGYYIRINQSAPRSKWNVFRLFYRPFSGSGCLTFVNRPRLLSLQHDQISVYLSDKLLFHDTPFFGSGWIKVQVRINGTGEIILEAGVGSSLRTRVDIDDIHFTADCTVSSCPRLQAPINSSMVCTSGNSFNSTCRFKCHTGYLYAGSAERTCLRHGAWSGAQPSCHKLTDVRLMNGSSTLEGRVEIAIQGAWGTICEWAWTSLNAKVVCSMLGYPGEAIARSGTFFKGGNGPIWLSIVECKGTESSITSCQTSQLSTGVKCQPKKSAGVICQNNTGPFPVNVRLTGGPSPRIGRAEVSFGNAWENLCLDGWTNRSAHVFCGMLGFGRQGMTFQAQDLGTRKPVSLKNVDCVGDETSIASCSHVAVTNWERCNNVYIWAIGVACGDLDVKVRLVGYSDIAGRVEISIQGVWGTVGDDNWSSQNARVVCRMLGYLDGGIPIGQTTFGEGQGPIWLNNVTCEGNEDSIFSCPHPGVESLMFVDHHKDASVICHSGSLDVRLNGGLSPDIGRVEISLLGQVWAPVSLRGWSKQDATVVCRVLGYNGSGEALSGLMFASETSVWFTQFQCNGSESSLKFCPYLIAEANEPHYKKAEAACGNKAICPRNCSCAVALEEGIGEVVNCSHTGLHAIPEPWQEYFRVLDLGHNNLVVINTSAFVGLDRLRILHLEYNRISVINAGGFLGLNILIELYLEHNRISSLNATAFLGLAYLKRLFLDYNDIHVIQPGTFAELDLLVELHLRHNRIVTLQGDIFKEQSRIATILFTGNFITAIDKNVTLGHGLYKIHLNENKIKLISRIHIEDEVRILSLDSNCVEKLKRFEFTRNRNLDVLSLADNVIYDIEDGAFLGLDQLRELTLSNNLLVTVRKETFQGLFNLRTLELDGNRLSNIGYATFDGMPMITLALRNNKLTEITRGIMPNSSNMFNIDISGNGIRTIEDGSLQRWSQIVVIHLARNQLEEIPANLSKHCRGLGSFDMSRNPIQVIRRNALETCSSLGYVIFVGCSIHHIEDLTFSSSWRLTYLFLDANRLFKIGRYTFAGLTSLKVLTLSNNPIRYLEEEAFRDSEYLSHLYLVGTLVQTIFVRLSPGPEKLTVFQSLEEDPSVIESILVDDNTMKESMEKSGFLCSDIPIKCIPCPQGTFKSGRECVPCPPGGFYQDEILQVEILAHGIGCKECSAGTYVKPEDAPGKATWECAACPDGTDKKTTAGYRACRCLEDFHRLNRFGSCAVCKRGIRCTNESVQLLPEFYWKWKSKSQRDLYLTFADELLNTNGSYKLEHQTFNESLPEVYPCPTPEACLGGVDSTCAEGYKGPLCASCDKRYYRLTGKCYSCPSFSWLAVQITVITAVVLGLAVLITKGKRRVSSNGRSLADILLARLKITVGFYQVTAGTLTAFSYIKWPETFVKLGRFAQLFQLNMIQFFPLECFKESLRSDAFTSLLANIILMVTTIGAAVVYYWARQLSSRRKWSVNENQTDFDRTSCKADCYRAVFLFLMITYPSTCTKILQVLPAACHEICQAEDVDCKSYLRSDYTVQCFTDRYNAFVKMAYALFPFIFGFPLLTLALLWKYHYKRLQATEYENDNHDGRAVSKGLRFLYENYTEDYWFWEIIELLRKVILTSILVYIGQTGHISLSLAAILSELYAVGFATFQPIQDKFEHWLMLGSLVAIMLNQTVGTMLKIPEDSVSSSVDKAVDSVGVTVLLVFANVLVVIMMTVYYAYNVGAGLVALKTNPQCNAECCFTLLKTKAPDDNEDQSDADTKRANETDDDEMLNQPSDILTTSGHEKLTLPNTETLERI